MKQLAPAVSVFGVLLGVSGTVYGDDLTFVANLSGAQEVVGPPFVAPQPGVESNARGRLNITFNPRLTAAQFRLAVNQGTGIREAHFHCAPAGVNGPIMVFLFGLVADPGVPSDGVLSEGNLTNANFQAGVDCETTCGQPVNNIASLRAAILEGCIYVNVHTVSNPAGEIRGQLRPAD
jgi:hypothetical protein